VKKGLKKFFDGGIRLVLVRKVFFIIINIYRFMHVHMHSSNILIKGIYKCTVQLYTDMF
jgi:hypothetical protein